MSCPCAHVHVGDVHGEQCTCCQHSDVGPPTHTLERDSASEPLPTTEHDDMHRRQLYRRSTRVRLPWHQQTEDEGERQQPEQLRHEERHEHEHGDQ